MFYLTLQNDNNIKIHWLISIIQNYINDLSNYTF